MPRQIEEKLIMGSVVLSCSVLLSRKLSLLRICETLGGGSGAFLAIDVCGGQVKQWRQQPIASVSEVQFRNKNEAKGPRPLGDKHYCDHGVGYSLPRILTSQGRKGEESRMS